MLFLFFFLGGGGMTRVKSLLGGAFFFLYIFLAVDAPLFPTHRALKIPFLYIPPGDAIFKAAFAFPLSTTSMAEIKSGRKKKKSKTWAVMTSPPFPIYTCSTKPWHWGGKGLVNLSLHPKLFFLTFFKKIVEERNLLVS